MRNISWALFDNWLTQESSGLKPGDDDDELLLQNGWPTKGVSALFSAGTIVRDSRHRNSPKRREQGLNLRRIWVQTLLTEAVQ